MIYATLCVGEKWCKENADDVNDLGKNNIVYVYTDFPDYFPNCKIVEYTRSEFSYYEKLPFWLRLIIKHKKRVVYIDCDSVKTIPMQIIRSGSANFDKKSVYTFTIFDNPLALLERMKKNPSLVQLIEIYKELGYDPLCFYLHEKLLSLPYKKNETEFILKEILNLQSIFEEKYYKGRFWEGIPNDETGTHECNKWSKYGCGYGEGGAISILVHNLNIPIKTIVSHSII